ncbi:hypothetical protein BDW68DRAFT_163024 [Aspergillus falconensis]
MIRATSCLGRTLVQQLVGSSEIDMAHCISVRSPSRLAVHEKIAVYQGDLASRIWV